MFEKERRKIQAQLSSKYKLERVSRSKGLEKEISQNATTYIQARSLYLEYFRGLSAIVTLDEFRLIETLENIGEYTNR